MDGFEILWGRVFSVLQDSEEYLLFSTNSNSNPNIVISAPPDTGPAASNLPARQPLRPRWVYGSGSGAYDNGDPVAMVVVVVFVVIVVVPVPEVNLGRRLREAEGYQNRNHRFFRTLPPPPFRRDDDCLSRCPTVSAVGEEEEKAPATTSPATTEAHRR